MNRRTLSFATLTLATSAGLLAGCGGAVGEALRPKDHTAAAASARASTCTSKYAKPLIVDLDQDTRATLEASMKKGLVVVGYDCGSFRVLNACKAKAAGYEYAGVSRKEEVIQMKSEDDVHGTLPISAIKVSAEVKSGRSIDLALVRVGMTSTSVATLSRDDLTGACEGATHFVQSATLGAYSMATDSIGKVGAVAEMFKVGAGSESERKAMNKDGLLEDCQKSDPDASAPPTQCRAPLQVDLLPITGVASVAETAPAEKPAKVEGRVAVVVANPCPEGFAFADGVCSRASTGPKLCDPTNESECTAECDKGSAESCLALGNLMKKSKRRPQAMVPFKKSCGLGNADGCGSLADLMDPEDEGPSLAGAVKAALEYAAKGCREGSGFACEVAGDYLTRDFYKIENIPAGIKAYERGCTLKRSSACYEAASPYAKGKGVGKDFKRAMGFFDRACQAGDALQCVELGKAFANGAAFGTTSEEFKDMDSAVVAFRRGCALDAAWCEDGVKTLRRLGNFEAMVRIAKQGCALGEDSACFELGQAYDAGEGVAADPGKAKELFGRACREGKGDSQACGKRGNKVILKN
ncbi:MAG: sel1 repeat family protein [Deltaproteobacteria bacterium]|nr:sel1 repeat family protein [Deltaproteobacteria bacterium]